MRFSVLLILILFSISGCDTSTTPDTDQEPAIDLDAPPVTTGEWYKPDLSVSWQWQIQGDVNTAYQVDLYDIDLFDVSKEQIESLQAAGKKVICYFSGGSYEDWRADASQFKADDLGNDLDGWPGERWLDIRSAQVHDIMKSRLDLAKQKGCDGVEPDNMDGFQNKPGFELTANDQLAYNRFMANEARTRGLSVGLKNALDQIPQLVSYYDFAVNEQCFEYDECDTLMPFVEQNKPVLHVEYLDSYVQSEDTREAMCIESTNRQFSSLVLPLDLDDAFRYSCF